MISTEEPVAASVRDRELQRIRAAYDRRDRRIPRGRYSHFTRAFFLEHVHLLGRVLSLLDRSGRSDLAPAKILDVGCGRGSWLRQFLEWGARPENLFGLDLLENRISECRKLCPSDVKLYCGDASEPRFSDGSMDLIMQFTVFTSILDPQMKKKLAQEMTRVLKPGGAILWYDYFVSNPRNPDVKGVRREEIAGLFPGLAISLERTTLAPPLGRVIGRISSTLYSVFSSIRPLCTHYLGLFEKPTC